MICPFGVAFVDVDDGFDVARLYLHDDRYAHVAVDFRLFEFFDDGSFGQVLNAYVDGRDDVATVDRLFVDDVEILVEYLAAVSDAIGTTEQTLSNDSSRPQRGRRPPSFSAYISPTVRSASVPKGFSRALSSSQWKPLWNFVRLNTGNFSTSE